MHENCAAAAPVHVVVRQPAMDSFLLLRLQILRLEFDGFDYTLKQLMFLRLVKDLRDVHIDPEPILYELGVHILLFNWLTLERWHKELEVAHITDF